MKRSSILSPLFVALTLTLGASAASADPPEQRLVDITGPMEAIPLEQRPVEPPMEQRPVAPTPPQGGTIAPPLTEPLAATLTGVIERREWSKSLESWHAGGSEYYVLLTEDAPAHLRSAEGGVILRPTAKIPAKRLEVLRGARVTIKGFFAPDQEVDPSAMRRAGGFEAHKMVVLKAAKRAAKPATR